MVGLSVVLEGRRSHLGHVINKNIAITGNTTDRRDQQPLVVNATSNEAMVIHHSSLLSPSTPPISPVNDGSSAPSADPRSFPGRETEWFNSFPQPSTVFLDRCSLCGTRLVPGRDIYMYKWAPSLLSWLIIVLILRPESMQLSVDCPSIQAWSD